MTAPPVLDGAERARALAAQLAELGVSAHALPGDPPYVAAGPVRVVWGDGHFHWPADTADGWAHCSGFALMEGAQRIRSRVAHESARLEEARRHRSSW